MRKARSALLIMALLALLGAHLHPQYLVCVEGTELPGCYSAAALRQGLRAAEEAAGEVLRYEAKMPSFERSLRLSLRPAGDDIPALTAALLRSVSGLTLADAVYLNGVPLGTVTDGERFCELLRDSIRTQMPLAAVSGNISGRLELRRVYTRADASLDDADMVLLVTGMAPVVYLDQNGRLA